MGFRKICGLIIAVIAAIIIIAFMLANRAPAALNFSIFSALWRGNEAAAITAPLFIWLFVFLIGGLIIGFLAAMPRLFARRRQIARLEQENARLKADLAAAAAKTIEAAPAPVPAAHY